MIQFAEKKFGKLDHEFGKLVFGKLVFGKLVLYPLLGFKEKVYVFGIPPRWPPESELEQFKANYQDHELFRYFTVNKRLNEESEKYLWGFSGH